jgi:ATP-dependent Clp protease ATP-binding subunit ClpC
MFERFTDRARRVVVLAQEEARELGHNYIGTEHILLGLLRVSDGVAARALDSQDITLDTVRSEVRQIIGEGEQSTLPSHIPFTPRTKKVLELSLREALQLGHNYIGTEHILLGLIREGDGVGVQILAALGANLNRVRQEVIRIVHRGETEPEMYLPGEGAPGMEQASVPRGTVRVASAAHPGPPVRVVGSRIQIEALNARIGEVISRLDLIAERLASIEGHLAAGPPPPARAPRKPRAAKPKPPEAPPPAGPHEPPAAGEAEQG